MSFTWNMTIDNSTDWSHIDFIRMFWEAKNERRVRLGQSADVLPDIGADLSSAVNDASALANGFEVHSDPLGRYTIRELQLWIQATVNSGGALRFSPLDYEGAAEPFTRLTPDVANGYPNKVSLYFQAGLQGTLGFYGFRRKRPRRILTTSSTTDTDGNTIANGHVAYLTNSHLLYMRTAGVWVLADVTTQKPDILDSELARPFYCANGAMEVGDYIGWWNWVELRACFNLLTRIAVQAGWYTEPGVDNERRENNDAAPVSTVWTTVRAYVAANYLGAATQVASDADYAFGPQMVFWGYRGSEFGTYAATALARIYYARSDLTLHTGLTSIPSKVEWVAAATGVSIVGITSTTSYTNEFDANGYPFTAPTAFIRKHHKFATLGASSDVVRTTTDRIPTLDTLPNQPVATPTYSGGVSHQVVHGFSLNLPYIILDYEVSGGFAYTPSAP